MASKGWWWGRSASIDVHGCDAALIRSKAAIAEFVRRLAKIVKMHRVGPAEIRRFGHGKLRGYSLMQFIETSTIIAHFDEQGKRAFIDVFSCKHFSPKKAAAFCQKFFRASDFSLTVEERR